MTVDETIASVGVTLLLCAFAAITWFGVPARSRAIGAVNLLGAGLSAYASYRIDFYPFVVLEGAWALVGLEILVRGPREGT
jgi:hypothetical protein